MQFTIYYIVSLFVMSVMMYRYRQNALALLILLITFTGVFDFFIPRGTQYMNIVKVIFGTYLFLRGQIVPTLRKYIYVVIPFAVFSVYFIGINLLYHFEGVLMVFSQYSKYYVTFLLLCLFLKIKDKQIGAMYYYNTLLLEVLIIQAVMSVFRYALFGFHFYEGMVGTFGGVKGGGTGTGAPLMALCWVALNTNMQFSKVSHWLFLAGLLMIGVATGKRAVIMLYPLLFLFLSVFVCHQRYNMRYVLMVVFMIPALLYVGVRLTPTLNPDGKVWGRFDLEHLVAYTKDYSGGETVEDTALTNQTVYKYEGRLGAVQLLWDKITDFDNYNAVTLFGEGVKKPYASTQDRSAYNDFGQQYGLNHKGDMTGIFMLIIAIGLVGVALFLWYMCSMVHLVSYIRFRWTVLSLVLFDFIFYNGTICRDPFIGMLLAFTIVYAQLQYSPKGKFVGAIHPFFIDGWKRFAYTNKRLHWH